MERCDDIILVVVVISEMQPNKWHEGVSQNAPIELTSEVSVGKRKGQFGTTLKSSSDVYRTTTTWTQ